MMKSITITAMSRPVLFRNMLRSLKSNNLEGWSIFIAIEPSEIVGEFLDIIDAELSDFDCATTVNETKLGVRSNPYSVLSRAFNAGSELNIYLEEDLIVSPDIVDLAIWYHKHHKKQWLLLNFLAGPCGSAGLLSNPNFPNQVFESQFSNSLGFVVRRNEWVKHMEPVWLNPREVDGWDADIAAYWRTHWGWDWSIYALVAASPYLRTVQPIFARSNHMGAQGTYCNEEIQERFFGRLQINSTRYKNYDLIDVDSIAHEVRSFIYVLHELSAMRFQMEATALKKIALQAQITKLISKSKVERCQETAEVYTLPVLASAAFPPGKGIILVVDKTTLEYGEFIVGGGNVALKYQTAGEQFFAANGVPAADARFYIAQGRIGVFFDTTSGNYSIFNNKACAITYSYRQDVFDPAN